MAVINQVLHRMNSEGTYDEIYLKANMANVTGTLALANGGTGATTAADARTALGAAASSHNHAASNITSGTLGVARGGTGLATLTSGSFLKGNGTSAVTLRTPAQVLSDIGAAASGHTHALTASSITGVLPVTKGGTGTSEISEVQAIEYTPYVHPTAKQCNYSAVQVQSWDASTGTLYLN